MGILSIPHLIIIFVVALVVFGPEKLPELARTLGRVMAEIRKATGDLRSTFDDHMRELEREARELDAHTREAARLPESHSILSPGNVQVPETQPQLASLQSALPPAGAPEATVANDERLTAPNSEKAADGDPKPV